MPVPVSPPAGDSSDESRQAENCFAATSLLKLPSMCKRRPSSPLAAICASAAIAGKKRLSVPIPSTILASRHASAARISASPGLSGYGAANLIPPDGKREGRDDPIMDLGDAERPQGAYRA